MDRLCLILALLIEASIGLGALCLIDFCFEVLPDWLRRRKRRATNGKR
ncbi:MAG: hypothetical protein PHD67_10255 [Oscillospiraceae bacterium]|nr:hypothetical protein [Oscillospiraceae bacterium]